VTGCLWSGSIPIWEGSINLSIGLPDLPHPGARLEWLASRNDLNQTQMGEAIETDQGTVSKIYNDRGKLTVEMAELASRQFGVPRGWLLFGEGMPWMEIGKAYQDGRRDAMQEAARVLSRIAEALPDPATVAKFLRQIGGAGR
jgi:plasmid maintenance system antidote protein VapI